MCSLLLDTSGNLLNVSLKVGDGEGFKRFSISRLLERNANEQVLCAVDSLLDGAGLAVADIDGFYVVNGPGSYTGVRIGVATLLGLADAVGKELKGVGTLDAYAIVSNKEKIQLSYKVRKNMFVTKSYNFVDNVFSDYEILTPDKLDEDCVLINGDDKPLSEAVFSPFFNAFITDYSPNYFRKSEAEISYEERCKN